MLKKFTFLLIFAMCFLLGGEVKFSKIPFENIVQENENFIQSQIKYTNPFKDQHTKAIGDVYVLVNIFYLRERNFTVTPKKNFPQGRIYYIGKYEGWSAYAAAGDEAENTIRYVTSEIAKAKGWTGSPPSYTKKREPRQIHKGYPKKEEFEKIFDQKDLNEYFLYEVEVEFYP
jgi:hypothetical protein